MKNLSNNQKTALRILVFISASLLIILGGLGMNYSSSPGFWAISFLLGAGMALMLIRDLEMNRRKRKNDERQPKQR